MSPHFCYRVDRRRPAAERSSRLSDYALASRLSYFLWSSMPDAELLAHAAAGDLHRPEVLAAQARRMLRDDRRSAAWPPSSAATGSTSAASRNTTRRSRAVPELQRRTAPGDVRGADPLLHRHRPAEPLGARLALRPTTRSSTARWPSTTACPDAGSPDRRLGAASTTPDGYGRGGLLPMAVFLTKNCARVCAPARSSAATGSSAACWARRFPPPPPSVPELPGDEAQARRLDAARSPGPAPGTTKLRRLPRAVRFGRPGLRGLWPDRRTPHGGPGRPAGRHDRRVFPGGGEGDRRRRLRATYETTGRTIRRQPCRKLLAYRLGPQLDPLGRRDARADATTDSTADDHSASVVWSNDRRPAPSSRNKRGRSRTSQHGMKDARMNQESAVRPVTDVSPDDVPPRGWA